MLFAQSQHSLQCVFTLSYVTFVYSVLKPHAEFMCRILLNSVITPHYLLIILIALSKEHLDTLMEIGSTVSGCT